MNLVNRTVAKFSMAVSAVAVLSACGQSPVTSSGVNLDTGIIGGADATGAEPFAKHVVGLYDRKIGAICTASILSETILVTAAHCVESEAAALLVVFGTDFDSPSIKIQPVEAYQTSPIWAFRQGQELNTGDIALVKFSGGLPAGYTPTNFLTDATKMVDNMDVLLAGFGASKVVMKQDPQTGATVADHQEAGKLRFVTTTIKNATYTKSEFMTDSSKGKSACHGDSGGPAYIQVAKKDAAGKDVLDAAGQPVLEAVLVGVTSRSVGDDADMCNVAAAYTSIPFYSSWIVTASKALNAPATKTPVVPVTVTAAASAN